MVITKAVNYIPPSPQRSRGLPNAPFQHDRCGEGGRQAREGWERGGGGWILDWRQCWKTANFSPTAMEATGCGGLQLLSRRITVIAGAMRDPSSSLWAPRHSLLLRLLHSDPNSCLGCRIILLIPLSISPRLTESDRRIHSQSFHFHPRLHRRGCWTGFLGRFFSN